MTVSTSRTAKRRRHLAAAAMLMAAPLAACSTVDRSVPTSAVPADYHLRHPVVLANEPTFLDIFPVGQSGQLDGRSLKQLAAFAADYRRTGQSRVIISAPGGAVDPVATERTIEAVRRSLFSLGVRGGVVVTRYRLSDPQLAAPLHLSYVALQARVASHCGDWPDDLNSGATLHGWENRSYYNLGCASTKTLSAQIDDPRDILGPRAEDPTDVQLRTRAIGLLRGNSSVSPGIDPGTAWTAAEPTPISSLGSQ